MTVRPAAALILALVLALTACSSPPTKGQQSQAPAPTATAAPVVVKELGEGTQDTPVDVDVAGPAHVVFSKITIKPGAGTGLHCHYGELIAVVEKGALTHYAPIYPSGKHVYVAGDSLVEGPNYVHQGKNEGTENVVLLVTYVIPEGKPLAEKDLTKCGH